MAIGYWFRDTAVLTHLSFYNRYKTAKRISEGNDLCEALRTILPEPRSLPKASFRGS